jgi:hypothetical protein
VPIYANKVKWFSFKVVKFDHFKIRVGWTPKKVRSKQWRADSTTKDIEIILPSSCVNDALASPPLPDSY